MTAPPSRDEPVFFTALDRSAVRLQEGTGDEALAAELEALAAALDGTGSDVKRLPWFWTDGVRGTGGEPSWRPALAETQERTKGELIMAFCTSLFKGSTDHQRRFRSEGTTREKPATLGLSALVSFTVSLALVSSFPMLAQSRAKAEVEKKVGLQQRGEAAVADRVSGHLTVGDSTIELTHIGVYEIFGSLTVILADRSLAGMTFDQMHEAGVQGLEVHLTKDGEPDEYGPGIVLHPMGDSIPEDVELDVERRGEFGFRGRIRLAEGRHFYHDIPVGFEAEFELELDDPCTTPKIELPPQESPSATAFAELYRAFAECRFGDVARHLTAEPAARWQSTLEGENAETEVATLMESMGAAPRKLAVSVSRESPDEAVLSVTITAPTGAVEEEEVVMRRRDGRWKLAGGLFF